MTVDPRPRYLLAGVLFMVAAVVALVAGSPGVALIFALVSAALFYFASRVKTVP
jgi:Flp pilus assembly protein TadB